MSLDNLAAWIAWLESSGGRGWLLAGVVIAVMLAAACVAWVASKATRLPARQRPARTVGCQRFYPSEDRVEEFIRDALCYEADQQMLRRGGRPDAPDVHDVFGGDDD